MITLLELCARYSRISLGAKQDNEEILRFLASVMMSTKRGTISSLRHPDFFALGHAQGDGYHVVLMRNDDGSLGGIAALSVSTMMIKGKVQRLIYASDLRLSINLSRKTRLQFHQWYEALALHCEEIEEFRSPFMITSIFDENTSAVRALVQKKVGKRNPKYRPIFPYQNINVIGRWPRIRSGTWRAQRCISAEVNELAKFLVSNPEGTEVLWTRTEIERKMQVLGLGFEDFLIVHDPAGNICGAALPYSDEKFRQVILDGLGLGMKVVGSLLPLMGAPAFRNGTPLKTGFLGFLRVRSDGEDNRADIVAALLSEARRQLRSLPKSKRLHSITLMTGNDGSLEKMLKQRGFVFTRLPATLYQVVHEKNFQRCKLLHLSRRKKPDFEVGLA